MFRFAVPLLAALCLVGRVAAQADFPPAALPGVDIGGALPATFEPSGAVWHPRLDRLIVVSDSGRLATMRADGTGTTSWAAAGDLEDVTFADPATDLIYLANEAASTIVEHNFVSRATTRTFNLAPFLPGGLGNDGIEGMTFVPDPADPEGGLFYVGLQLTGDIYVFRLSIRSSATATSVTFVRMFTPAIGRSDLAGLCFDRETGVLYAIWDTADLVRAMHPDGTFIAEWILPGSDQEGIALHGSQMFIPQDPAAAHAVLRYGPFPRPTRPDWDAADADGDGLDNALEVALGLDPYRPSAASAPSASVLAVNGVPHLAFTYTLSKTAGLACTPEVSTDLSTWASGGASIVETGRVDLGPVEQITVRDAQPLSAHPQRFFRLRRASR